VAADVRGSTPLRGRAAVVVILLCGIIAGGCVGWLVGTELGRWATRGCQEFECIVSAFWSLGGVFIGIVAGTVLGLFGARLARPRDNRD
jgi:hypothetical protein